MATPLQTERAKLLPHIYSIIASSSFSDIPPHFSDSFEYWQIGPPTVAAVLPYQGKFESIEVVLGALQFLKAGAWATAKNLEVLRAIHEGDTMALRGMIHAISADGVPYDMPFVMFVDFEPDTARIVRIEETIDSAYAQALSARLKAAKEAAEKAAAESA